MVPLGNVAFTLPFVPGHSPLQVTDIIGLIVICAGLGCYRFAAKLVESYFNRNDVKKTTVYEGVATDNEDETKSQLYSKLIPVAGENGSNSRNSNSRGAAGGDDNIVHS